MGQVPVTILVVRPGRRGRGTVGAGPCTSGEKGAVFSRNLDGYCTNRKSRHTLEPHRRDPPVSPHGVVVLQLTSFCQEVVLCRPQAWLSFVVRIIRIWT